MRRHSWIALGAVVSVFLIAVLIAVPRFLPESSRRLAEAAPEQAATLASGSWSGRAGHSASGTVALVSNASGTWVRFEDFEMTAGPAVYLYLSMVEEPDSREEIQDSWRLPIDGGAEGGELTKRGDFNQRLPEGFDVGRVKGLGAWCDDFTVPFAIARMVQTTPNA